MLLGRQKFGTTPERIPTTQTTAIKVYTGRSGKLILSISSTSVYHGIPRTVVIREFPLSGVIDRLTNIAREIRHVPCRWGRGHERRRTSIAAVGHSRSTRTLQAALPRHSSFVRPSGCYHVHNIQILISRKIHSNCQNTPVVWDDDINQRRTRWGPFVTIAVQYKWIWLNRGDGSAQVEIVVVQRPQFWDEMLSSDGHAPTDGDGHTSAKVKSGLHMHAHGWGGHRS